MIVCDRDEEGTASIDVVVFCDKNEEGGEISTSDEGSGLLPEMIVKNIN